MSREKTAEIVTDSDLDDLLDEALNDFDAAPIASSSVQSKTANTNENINTNSLPEYKINPEELFGQFFDKEITKSLQNEWDKALNELEQEEGKGFLKNLQTEIQGENSCSTEAPEISSVGKNTETINQKLKSTFENLNNDIRNKKSEKYSPSESFDNIGSSGMSVEDMMGDLNFDGPAMDEFLNKQGGMMEGLMSTLLSKEMMYVPMKELCEKFEPWIEKGQETFTKKQVSDYSNQLKLLKKICTVFEEEKESDTEQIKNLRTTKVISLVDELQKYGEPPHELVGDTLQDGISLKKSAEMCCIQ